MEWTAMTTSNHMEKNNSYDKSKDSSMIKKIKCNNINVNVNGFNGDNWCIANSS